MSGLRCWPGCLAYVVRSNIGLAGRTVRCIRLHTSETHDLDGTRFLDRAVRGPRWIIEKPILVAGNGGPLYTVADALLRPILPPPTATFTPTETEDTAPCETHPAWG